MRKSAGVVLILVGLGAGLVGTSLHSSTSFFLAAGASVLVFALGVAILVPPKRWFFGFLLGVALSSGALAAVYGPAASDDPAATAFRTLAIGMTIVCIASLGVAVLARWVRNR